MADDDGAPPEARELLRSLRNTGRTRALPAGPRARSAARLDRMLALPAAAAILLWLKGVAVAAGIGVLGVVVVKAVPALMSAADRDIPARTTAAATAASKTSARQLPTAMPPATSTPTSTPPAIPTPTTAAEAPIAPTTPATAQAPTPAPSPHPGMEADSLARETAMLDRARGLLESDPVAALAALDAHAAAYPAGHMTLERELLALEALRRLHRVSEARARGEALLQRARGSIYEERVGAILDALPR